MAYRDLIKELKQIVSVGLSEQQHDLNLAITHTNWEIGKRLIEVNQGGNVRAAYGEQVLENISSDLRKSYGRGYSIVNLRLMRNFSKIYDKKSIRKELLWSHYRLLLQFKDETLRKKLENLTIKNSWGYRELAFHIQKTKKATDQLTRPTGITGVQQVRRVVETGKELFFLDLGFNIWIPAKANALNEFADRQLVFVEQGNFGWKVKLYYGENKNRWLFEAKPDYVVDGDTLVVFIELALGIRTRQILRLNAINAAPLTEPIGIKARDYLVEQIEKGGKLFLKTYKRDKYARFVADVFVGNSDDSVTDVIEKGLFLNQELLSRNLAVRAL